MRKFIGTIIFSLAFSAWPALAETGYVEPGETGGAGNLWVYHGGSGSYLGIDTQEVTADQLATLKLKEERGVEVVMVDQDSPAGKAGLKEHDVILEFNGAKVEGIEQLRRLIHETPPGRTVALGISRDGQLLTLQAQLADRAKAFSSANSLRHPKAIPFPPESFSMPEITIPTFDFTTQSGTRCGLLVENLTPQLGEYFGVKAGEGVLVRSVEKGSPAEAAGFRAGDVVVKVENERIANRGDWKMALRAHSAGKVTVGIVRDRREQTVTMTLPEKLKDSSRGFHIEVPDIDLDLENFDLDLDQAQIQTIQDEQLEHAAQLIARNRAAVEQATALTRGEIRRALERARRTIRKAQETVKESFGQE